MGCSCSSSNPPEKSINNFKQSIRNRNETIIVEWSKATYAGGGAYGDNKFDGVVSLTNISFYFVANGNKFELPLKRIDEIQEVRNNYADLKKPNERFAVFKLKENREFGMVFLENQDKLHSDLKTLIIQQGQGSKLKIKEKLIYYKFLLNNDPINKRILEILGSNTDKKILNSIENLRSNQINTETNGNFFLNPNSVQMKETEIEIEIPDERSGI